MNSVFKRVQKPFKWTNIFLENRLFIAILLNAMFLVYALVFGQLTFETNDDREISNILSNVYDSKYSSYIVFINIIVGYVLRFFYVIIPSVNWYVIISLFLNFLSLTAISWCFYKKADLKVGSLFSLAFLVMFFYDSYVLFQFTKNAFLYLTAGYLLIFTSYKIWRKSIVALACGIFLTVVGSLIRFQSFIGAIPFIFLIIILEIFQTYKSKEKQKLSLFVCIATSSILIIGCRAFNLYQYESNEEWSYYREYNENRAALTDYEGFEPSEHVDELSELGITTEDYELITKFTYGDTQVFSLDVMKELASLKEEYSSTNPIISKDILFAFVSDIIDICQNHMYIYAIALLGFLGLTLGVKKGCPIFFMLGIVFAEWYMYIWMGRLVYRVIYGAILFGITFSLFYLLKNENNIWTKMWHEFGKSTRNYISLLIGVVILLCSIPQSMVMISNKVYFQENTEYEGMLEEIANHKDTLYLIDRPTLTILEENYSPYKVIDKGAYENLCVIGGWVYPTPQNNAPLEQFDIENPLEEFSKEKNILLIDGVSPQLKESYLQRHYDSNIVLESVKEYPLYNIYKIQKN